MTFTYHASICQEVRDFSPTEQNGVSGLNSTDSDNVLIFVLLENKR